MNETFELRELRESDYAKQYLNLTGQLSGVGEIREEQFSRIVRERAAQGIFTWVLEDAAAEQGAENTQSNSGGGGKIVGTISLFYERKFYRNGQCAAHIEDVIVDAAYRHHNLGTRLVRHALEHAKHMDCYKVILDCKENLEHFYAISGFTKCNIQMAYYLHH